MTYVKGPELKGKAYQIVLGTILGGSSIIKPKNGKNCYLSMRSKYARWLEYKADFLSEFSSQAPYTIEKTNRWHSSCFPVFNEFRETFYSRDRRTLNEDKISPLNDFGFAVWYGDCGKYDGKQVTLNTHVWKDKSKFIVRYLDLVDISSSVKILSGKYRVVLSHEGSKKFIEIVSPQLPFWFEG